MSLENPKQNRPEEKQLNLSRRQLLTGAAVLAGGALLEGCVSESGENLKTAEGRILRKETKEGRGVFKELEHIHPEFATMPKPTDYFVYIEIKGHEVRFKIEREQFDNFKENQSVTVTYVESDSENGTAEIRSIK